MPPRRKNYRPDALNPEDISRSLANSRQLIENWIEQMVTELIAGNPTYKQASASRFRRKSNQTLREFTAALAEPLKETVEEGYALPQEVCLALVSAAMLIHLTYSDPPTKNKLSGEDFLDKCYGETK